MEAACAGGCTVPGDGRHGQEDIVIMGTGAL